MTVASETITAGRSRNPGSLARSLEEGAASPPRGSSPVPDRAGRTPLRSAHSQRDDGARIFSREWRALGDAAPKPKHKSGPKHPAPPHRRLKPHVPEAIHFSRKGETRSMLDCSCGHFLETVNIDRRAGHAELADLFSAHRLQALRLAETPA